jgi:hypothetical protein
MVDREQLIVDHQQLMVDFEQKQEEMVRCFGIYMCHQLYYCRPIERRRCVRFFFCDVTSRDDFGDTSTVAKVP